MARTYSVTGDQAIASPAITVLSLQSATTIRPAVYFFVISPLADAIDFMVRWIIERFDTTDDGTGDTPVINAMNDFAAVAAATTVAQDNHSAEPDAYNGDIPLELAMNTRAPQQWHAHDQADRIVLPAVATSGIGWQVLSTATTSGVIVNAHWEE